MSSPNVNLRVPDTSVCVSVKIIDTTTLSGVPVKNLLDPPLPGLEFLPPAPSFSFLLEHPEGQKVLFDLGIPKDTSVLGAAVAERISKGSYRIDVTKDVADVLEDYGIKRSEINAVVWR